MKTTESCSGDPICMSSIRSQSGSMKTSEFAIELSLNDLPGHHQNVQFCMRLVLSCPPAPFEFAIESSGGRLLPVMRGTVACGPAPGVDDALPLPMDHSIPSSVLSHCIDFQNTPEDGILNPGAFWPVAETEWHWKLVNFTAADW